MAGWGLNPVADDNKPFWLSSAEKAACYATAAGWAYRQPSGNEEILVAIRGLSTTLAGANLTSVFFDARSYAGGATGNVIIAFDEAITVGGGHTGVLNIDWTGTAANITSSAGVAVTGETNQIRYQFTVPTAGIATPATYTTFSVAGTGYVQATDAAATLATVGGGGTGLAGTYSADAGGNLTDVKITGTASRNWDYNETVSVSDGASGTDGRFTLTSVQGALQLDITDDLGLTNLTAITDTVGGGAITSLTTAIQDAAKSTIDGTTYSDITVLITS